MHVDDPKDTTTPDAPVDTPEVDDVAASLDAGIAEATPEPTGEPPVPGTQEALGAKDGEGEPESGKDVPTEDKSGKDDKPDDKDKRPSDEFGDLPKDAKAETRERFDKLRGAYDDLHKQLEAAGIKDVGELPALAKRAENGQFLLEQVQSVATPEQFGQTMDYLGLLKDAQGGDKTAAEKAFTMIEGEYKALAQVLGRPIEGIHDPLAEYPDLQAEVEAGDTKRERALEIAQARNDRKAAENAATRRQQEDSTKQQQEQAVTQARQSLNALEAELKADPHYAAKREALVAKVKEICRDFPPDKWAAVAKLAYQAIPNPAPAAAAKPAPGPMRASGPRPAIAPAVYDNPEDALEAGIAAASAA